LLAASQIQPYNPVYEYKVDFFHRERWDTLITSVVGEYFLSRYVDIKGELRRFEEQMDAFNHLFDDLLRSVGDSPAFLTELIDTYARLIQRERIPRSQFAEYDLQEIAVPLLGQLGLQVSHHQIQSKEALLKFTAYALLGLNLQFPTNSLSDDHKLVAFCRDTAKRVEATDQVLAEPVKKAKLAFEDMKKLSTDLWKQLKELRIEIATRYNATLE